MQRRTACVRARGAERTADAALRGGLGRAPAKAMPRLGAGAPVPARPASRARASNRGGDPSIAAADVLALKRALVRSGHLEAHHAETASMDAFARDALALWQRDQGIAPTGEFGPLSRQVMAASDAYASGAGSLASSFGATEVVAAMPRAVLAAAASVDPLAYVALGLGVVLARLLAGRNRSEEAHRLARDPAADALSADRHANATLPPLPMHKGRRSKQARLDYGAAAPVAATPAARAAAKSATAPPGPRTRRSSASKPVALHDLAWFVDTRVDTPWSPPDRTAAHPRSDPAGPAGARAPKASAAKAAPPPVPPTVRGRPGPARNGRAPIPPKPKEKAGPMTPSPSTEEGAKRPIDDRQERYRMAVQRARERTGRLGRPAASTPPPPPPPPSPSPPSPSPSPSPASAPARAPVDASAEKTFYFGAEVAGGKEAGDKAQEKEEGEKKGEGERERKREEEGAVGRRLVALEQQVDVLRTRGARDAERIASELKALEQSRAQNGSPPPAEAGGEGEGEGDADGPLGWFGVLGALLGYAAGRAEREQEEVREKEKGGEGEGEGEGEGGGEALAARVARLEQAATASPPPAEKDHDAALLDALEERLRSLETAWASPPAPSPTLTPPLTPTPAPTPEKEGEGEAGVLAPVLPAVLPMLWRLEAGQEILLQGFHWESHTHDWYGIVREKAPLIAGMGFTGVWLPPPSDSIAPQGYLPRDLYRLDSSYGSMDALVDLIGCIKHHNMHAVADVVINHRCATHRGGGGAWNTWQGVGMAWDERAVCSSNPQFCGQGGPKQGDDFTAAPNIDHTQSFVREDLKDWLRWLVGDDVGFSSLRFDFVKGYAGRWVGEYVEACSPELAVGEFWDTLTYGEDGGLAYDQEAHRQRTVDWIDQTGGKAAAFDFTTKGILQVRIFRGDRRPPPERAPVYEREGPPPYVDGIRF